MVGSVLTLQSLLTVMKRVLMSKNHGKDQQYLGGVCYKPAKQVEEADKIFHMQLEEDSQLLAFALMGDLNLPGVFWKYNRVERKQVSGVCGRELPDMSGGQPEQGLTGAAVCGQRRTGG